jgi:phenylacetate-CoA ligase
MNERLVSRYLFPLHERLKGKPTFRLLAELEASQWLPPRRLEEYRLRRLRRFLEFVHEHVPYCRALFDEHGLRPRSVHSFEDLGHLPFLTRARATLPGVHRRSSGGSTGTPVTVLVDMERMGMGEAGRLRAHRWYGVEPGTREIVLWGTPARTGALERVRQLRDRFLNTRVLSAFDMGDQGLRRHAATIQRVRPTQMFGYASAFHLVASHFQRERLDPPGGLKAVFTTAEPLFDFQRKTIEAALGCPVGVEYGCRDGGLVALECPSGGLHILAESMHVEILDPDVDGRGEIVLTNLDSRAFPILRYRTGDIGALDPTPCPCGRSLPKLRGVEGRRTDFLVTPSGRVLHALSAIYVLRDSPSVREFRVVQDAPDHLLVEIVPSGAFGEAEQAALRAQFVPAFGSDLRVSFEAREEILRTAAGKFRYVESRIAPAVLERLMQTGDPQGAITNDL